MVAPMGTGIASSPHQILARHDLNEKQRAFLVSLLSGMSPSYSARAAGFSETSWFYVIRIPAVASALHECVQADILADSPTNLKVLRKIRDNEKAPAGVRSDIAIKLMRMAGHIEPTKADDNGPTKQLSEMSADELRQYIERNQAEIDRIEGELAARAIDVSAPNSAPNEPIEQANPLNYLD
jgi:uncharacterized small protein (DUF1192 family)